MDQQRMMDSQIQKMHQEAYENSIRNQQPVDESYTPYPGAQFAPEVPPAMPLPDGQVWMKPQVDALTPEKQYEQSGILSRFGLKIDPNRAREKLTQRATKQALKEVEPKLPWYTGFPILNNFFGNAKMDHLNYMFLLEVQKAESLVRYCKEHGLETPDAWKQSNLDLERQMMNLYNSSISLSDAEMAQIKRDGEGPILRRK